MQYTILYSSSVCKYQCCYVFHILLPLARFDYVNGQRILITRASYVAIASLQESEA